MKSDTVDVSVVIPCLNEEEGIGSCIKKIQEVYAREQISGEVVIADNGSTDHSIEIAKELGARVVHQPIRGYGAAYIKGLSEARGKYIIIADGDDTYDFYYIPAFIKPLKEGYEFVMGDRLKGRMSKDAMPWANRYIGNPILSGICRLFFGTKLGDIYCGMRAFSRQAYEKMHLRCLGMEFAIEMVLEALQKKLKTQEIIIDYLPRKGASKLRPLQDAWRAFRLMLVFSPMWLYFIPGFLIISMGFAGLVLLARGPFNFLGHAWDIHAYVLAALLGILGYQIINLGLYARTFAIGQGYLATDRTITFVSRHFNLEMGLLAGGIIFLGGFIISLFIFIEWWRLSFGALYRIREAILAMTFMVIGVQTIFSSFFLSLLMIRR